MQIICPYFFADGDPQTIRLVDPLGTNDSASRFLRIRVTAP